MFLSESSPYTQTASSPPSQLCCRPSNLHPAVDAKISDTSLDSSISLRAWQYFFVHFLTSLLRHSSLLSLSVMPSFWGGVLRREGRVTDPACGPSALQRVTWLSPTLDCLVTMMKRFSERDVFIRLKHFVIFTFWQIRYYLKILRSSRSGRTVLCKLLCVFVYKRDLFLVHL